MRLIDPKRNEIRVKSWFAFWPVHIGGETRWFERVTIKQEFSEEIDWYNCKWQNINFIDEKTN